MHKQARRVEAFRRDPCTGSQSGPGANSDSGSEAAAWEVAALSASKSCCNTEQQQKDTDQLIRKFVDSVGEQETAS
jgi:hypothetical protein